MTYTTPWPDLPEKIRSYIIGKTFDMVLINNEQNLKNLNIFLSEYNAMYNGDNTITFKSEAHYRWFLLRWS